MANQFELKISGLPGLKRAFRALSDDVRKKVLKKAARVAGNRYLERAKQLVRRRSRRGHDSLHIRFQRSSAFEITALVANKAETFYLMFIEFGHRIGSSGGGGGRIKAFPFMRPAFDERTSSAISGANFEFAKGLKKAARRGRRRSK